MAERIKINEIEAEGVVGGLLIWEGGVVYPMDNPNARYEYADYTACQQWLIANWNTAQKENCLKAMEKEGLVHKL